MKKVWVIADNIYSPLSNSTQGNFEAVASQKLSIQAYQIPTIFENEFYASLFKEEKKIAGFTRLESYCVASVARALSSLVQAVEKDKTIFILSSTKGNIELIENDNYSQNEISLYRSAEKITRHFGIKNKPIVISNACISGVLAINMAQQLLAHQKYEYAIVCGADMLSKFVISGFHALGAASIEICKPFDRDRKGINLGECAATIVLSSNKNKTTFNRAVLVQKGFSSNDANHISGPSRTGAELADAIQKTMQRNQIENNQISFINAHGTGTRFNDEMESKAFKLCGIETVPTNSFKANLGHTLGAAGVVESILSYHSLLEEKILPSKNFYHQGTENAVNINMQCVSSHKNIALKTASGFGGCNAVVAFEVE